MTSATTLALTEIRRLSRSVLGRAAILAILIVPLMYGALYLWAFWDPYGRLDTVPVALVDQDRPVTVDGKTIAAGHDLEATLRDRGGFDWNVVDAQEAADGLDDGRYYLVVTVPEDFSAALASPGQAPAGATGAQGPRRAVLDVRTDDTNGYIAGQLSRSVLLEVRAALSSSTTKQYVGAVYASLGDIRDGLGTAADGAGDLAEGTANARRGAADLATGTQKAADGAAALAAGARRLDSGAASLRAGAVKAAQGAQRLDTGAGDLAAGLRSLDQGAAALPASTRRLATGSDQVADGAAELAAALRASADGRDALGGVREDADAAITTAVGRFLAAHPGDPDALALAGTIQNELGRVDAAAATAGDRAASAAGRLAAGARTVAAGNRRLATSAPALARGVHRAAAGAAAVDSGASTLSRGTASLASGSTDVAAGTHRIATSGATLAQGARRAANGSADLRSGLVRLDDGAGRLAERLGSRADDIPVFEGADAQNRASVVASPVELHKDPINVASSYGVGFAPYFIPLAMWVGAVVTYLVMRPLAPRALAGTTRAVRVALGGWLPAAGIGIGQTLALFAVLRWGIGLDAVHPWALVGFLILTAASFTALLQWVNVRFGEPGKLIAITLLILQLTSAGGTYPIETAPRFFQVLHPWMPMTYVVQGLRHLITGGPSAAIWQSTGVLAGIALVSFTLTVLAARRKRIWTVARLHPELEL